MKQQKHGVILCNMGGPHSLDDVQPFLYNLFSDRMIIQLGPAFMQKPLAWIISKRRAPKSRALYQRIGGGSPLQAITAQQAAALEQQLNQSGQKAQDCHSFTVRYAMRYWEPRAAEVISSMKHEGVDDLIALSLYPHYSEATTGSSLHDLRDQAVRLAPELPLTEISSYPAQEDYIQALESNIREGLQKFPVGAPVELVYSAHSLPVSFIDRGDSYIEHLTQTIAALEARIGVHGHLCYQSRSGPVRWLEPATDNMLRTLAEQGTQNVLMVPISFVSDHIETLYEIDMLFRDQAATLGMRLERSPSLNTNPHFISALEKLVLEAVHSC